MKRFFVLVLMLTFARHFAHAESTYGIWSGVGVNAIGFGQLHGQELEGRRLVIIGVHYGRTLVTHNDLSFLYTIDAVPIVLATGSEALDRSHNIIRKSIYGFGLAPVGFQVNFKHGAGIQPFAFTSGGFVRFNQPTPTPIATRWNFTADAGGGLQFDMGKQRAIAAGYRLHHISNAGTGRGNPSLNTNILYLALYYFH